MKFFASLIFLNGCKSFDLDLVPLLQKLLTQFTIWGEPHLVIQREFYWC